MMLMPEPWTMSAQPLQQHMEPHMLHHMAVKNNVMLGSSPSSQQTESSMCINPASHTSTHTTLKCGWCSYALGTHFSGQYSGRPITAARSLAALPITTRNAGTGSCIPSDNASPAHGITVGSTANGASASPSQGTQHAAYSHDGRRSKPYVNSFILAQQGSLFGQVGSTVAKSDASQHDARPG